MYNRASLISLVFVVVIITLLSHQTNSKSTDNGNNHKGNAIEKSQQRSVIFLGQNTRSDEIVWLLNQLIDILNEMVSGLEMDPSLLHNQNFRQILAHMIRRIDHILEHFENMRQLPREIKSALHRLDCVRIRLSNYIGSKTGQQQDDSICYENGMMTSTKKPHKEGGGDQNQMMVIISQIVYILVQIVNRMGPTDNSGSKHKSTTMSGSKTTGMDDPDNMGDTTPFNWDDMVNQYSSTSGPLTNTPDWNQLISQIMDQMGSTIPGVDMGVTPDPSATTTVDWGELISAVVAEIEKQYGTTPAGMGQPNSGGDPGQGNGNWDDMVTPWEWNQSSSNNDMVTPWDWDQSGSNKNTASTEPMDWYPWPNMVTTQSSANSGKTTVVDIQSCIDSIMQIVTDITNQLPDNRGTTTTTTPSPDSTQDLSEIMAGILGQFG